MPSINIPLSDNFSLGISLGVGIGPHGLMGGINVSANYQIEDWSFSIAGGVSSNTLSYGGSVGYKNFGIGYSQAQYFFIGTHVVTNHPGVDGPPEYPKSGRPDRMGNYNKHGKSSWKDGQVYTAPLYAGYRNGNQVYKIGYSAEIFQDRTQNWVHRNGFFYLPFGHQNFYVDYDNFRRGFYSQFGNYNPFSLWGY